MAKTQPPETLTANYCPDCGSFANPGTVVLRNRRHYLNGRTCDGTFQQITYRKEPDGGYENGNGKS